MDDPFVAILFAEDLIDFVLCQHRLLWSHAIGIRKYRYHITRARFTSVVGLCVMEIIDAKDRTIRSCYDALLQRGVVDVESFRLECMISTVFHFPQGYDHELFLNLCAMVVGLSVLYFRDGREAIAIGASHVLAYVMNFYIYHLDFNVRTDWFNLAVKAQSVRRGLAKEVADANSKAIEST